MEKTSTQEAQLSEQRPEGVQYTSSVMQQVKTPPKEEAENLKALSPASLEDLQPRTPDPLELL